MTIKVVEIEQLAGRQFVRVIENGEVSIRRFDRVMEAEAFADGERTRLGLSKVVRR
jgi:hypothetical protein